MRNISVSLSSQEKGAKGPFKWLVHIWWFFLLPQLKTNRVVNQNKYKGLGVDGSLVL